MTVRAAFAFSSISFVLLCSTPVARAAHSGDEISAARSACAKLRLRSVSCAAPTGYPDPATSPMILGPSPEPDSRGLRRDVYYFVGWQFAIIGILYVAPESFSNWSDEQKEEKGLDDWWDNVTHPVWDEDDHVINYVLHPYWGATYFVRARERGYGNRSAFWYSVTLSSLYEFGAEAFFENPSIQDLIVTPVVGSLVGVQFMKFREGIRERVLREGHYRPGDRWWLVLTDPLGSVNRLTDRILRIDTDIQVRPIFTRQHTGDPLEEAKPYYGLRVSLTW